MLSLGRATAASTGFSAGLRFNTDDLNDFLAPELNCVLPIQVSRRRANAKTSVPAVRARRPVSRPRSNMMLCSSRPRTRAIPPGHAYA